MNSFPLICYPGTPQVMACSFRAFCIFRTKNVRLFLWINFTPPWTTKLLLHFSQNWIQSSRVPGRAILHSIIFLVWAFLWPEKVLRFFHSLNYLVLKEIIGRIASCGLRLDTLSGECSGIEMLKLNIGDPQEHTTEGDKEKQAYNLIHLQ